MNSRNFPFAGRGLCGYSGCARLAMSMASILLLLLVGAAMLRGQVPDPSGQAAWVVLDFENHSSFGGQEVGRYATDSVVLELGQLSRYDLVSRAETQRALQTLQLTPPLSVIGEQRLGRQLGVTAVVTGVIESVIVSDKLRQAQVVLAIKVRNPKTGELINGARILGVSEPHAAPLTDSVSAVNEAITNAAFTAVEQMSQHVLPRATVLVQEDTHTILINQGAQAGITVGIRMVVTRFGNRVGVIKVTRVEADQSEAVIVEPGAGMAPQDVATAIYSLPKSPVHP